MGFVDAMNRDSPNNTKPNLHRLNDPKKDNSESLIKSRVHTWHDQVNLTIFCIERSSSETPQIRP